MPRYNHPRRGNVRYENPRARDSLPHTARERFTRANAQAEVAFLAEAEQIRQAREATCVTDDNDSYTRIPNASVHAIQTWTTQFRASTEQLAQTLRNWSGWWTTSDTTSQEGEDMPITTQTITFRGDELVEPIVEATWAGTSLEQNEPVSTDTSNAPENEVIAADISRMLVVSGEVSSRPYVITMYDIDAAQPGSPAWIQTMRQAIDDAVNAVCGAIFDLFPASVDLPEHRSAWVRPANGHATPHDGSDAPPWTWAHNPLCSGAPVQASLSWWYTGSRGIKPEPFLHVMKWEEDYDEDTGSRLVNPVTGRHISVPCVILSSDISTVRRRVFRDDTTYVPYLQGRSSAITHVLSDDPAVSRCLLEETLSLVRNVNRTLKNCFVEHYGQTSRRIGEFRSVDVTHPRPELTVSVDHEPLITQNVPFGSSGEGWSTPQPVTYAQERPRLQHTITFDAGTTTRMMEQARRAYAVAREANSRSRMRSSYQTPDPTAPQIRIRDTSSPGGVAVFDQTTNQQVLEGEPLPADFRHEELSEDVIPEPTMPSSRDTGLVAQLQTELARLEAERATAQETSDLVSENNREVSYSMPIRRIETTRRYG